MRRRILMCLAVLLLLSGMGAASASDVLAAQSEALDLDALQDAAGGYLPDGALEAGISLDEGLQTILNTGSGQISGVVRKAVRSGVLLLTVVLLCGLAEGLYGGMGVSQTTDVVAIVGALAITAVAVADAQMAGLLTRYFGDFVWLGMVGSLLAILACHGWRAENGSGRRFRDFMIWRFSSRA